jgi:hypothetical protein
MRKNMLRWIAGLITISVAFAITPAEARYHHYRHVAHAYMADSGCNLPGPNMMVCEGVSPSPRGLRVVKAMGDFGAAKQKYTPPVQHEAQIVGGRPLGCPHAFCGCEASLYRFGRIVPELNLAWTWAVKFPRISPEEAGNGDAAVRHGHVAIVLANLGNGNYQLHDGNSGGHLTRVHVRHLSGYVFVRPTGV